MIEANDSDTKFVNRLITDLSLILFKTGVSNHTVDNDTWNDIILVVECDTIISFDITSPNFANRHNIISVTIHVLS